MLLLYPCLCVPRTLVSSVMVKTIIIKRIVRLSQSDANDSGLEGQTKPTLLLRIGSTT